MEAFPKTVHLYTRSRGNIKMDPESYRDYERLTLALSYGWTLEYVDSLGIRARQRALGLLDARSKGG
ncbi:MAG: hypothetical protein GTO63_27640 [Anaerolineae bacterium]|nr:hypothetical protein [Anaerolineae bacterium]NIN98504.1 hypothetical protein [Anaerolineae bacterium]